jgi:hypothetical protein
MAHIKFRLVLTVFNAPSKLLFARRAPQLHTASLLLPSRTILLLLFNYDRTFTVILISDLPRVKQLESSSRHLILLYYYFGERGLRMIRHWRDLRELQRCFALEAVLILM